MANLQPLRVFTDCEFTDFQDMDLLSIGFVCDASDDELYIEITDPDPHCVPSEFVVETVLPLFGRHNPERLTRDNAAKRIDRWLDGLRGDEWDRPVVMVSDSQLDWTLLTELWPMMPGQRSWASRSSVNGQLIQWLLVPPASDVFFALVDEYHAEHGEQHHALVDARAMKAAFQRLA